MVNETMKQRNEQTESSRQAWRALGEAYEEIMEELGRTNKKTEWL